MTRNPFAAETTRAFITARAVIDRILDHLRTSREGARAPPPVVRPMRVRLGAGIKFLSRQARDDPEILPTTGEPAALAVGARSHRSWHHP